jgi:hypothetical protein
MNFRSKHWRLGAPPHAASVSAMEGPPSDDGTLGGAVEADPARAADSYFEITMLPPLWRSGSIDRADIQRLAGHDTSGP